MTITIDELIKVAYETAKSKGWHEEDSHDSLFIALMHSELGEATEELRNGHPPDKVYTRDGKPEGVPIELADLVIRVADYCGHRQIDLTKAIAMKLAYNKTRSQRHGGKKF